MLWSKDELKSIITKPNTQNVSDIYGIALDSRDAKNGDLFIPLIGEHQDGHIYIEQAFENGASACFQQSYTGTKSPALPVEDTYKALKALANMAISRSQAVRVGITGSVGKTGTRELLKAALSPQAKTHASIKSYNNHVGVPYTLATMPRDTEIGLFEMGMNHKGEMSELSHMVRPDIALITKIAPTHIENFSDGIDGIARAKGEIMDGMSPGSIIILNRDDDQFPILETIAKNNKLTIKSFGRHSDADVRLQETRYAANAMSADIFIAGKAYTITIPWMGDHIAENLCAVLLTVHVLGKDIDQAIQAFTKQRAPEGRGRIEEFELEQGAAPLTLIDESYNASPPAMEAAFRVMALIDSGVKGRKIVVLGDMLELGDQARMYHEQLAQPIEQAGIDLVYTCGTHMKALHKKLPHKKRALHKETSTELASIIPDVLVPGDIILVKGSNGSKMGVVIEALRQLPKSHKVS